MEEKSFDVYDLNELLYLVTRLNSNKEFSKVESILSDEILKKFNDQDLYAEKIISQFYLNKIEECKQLINEFKIEDIASAKIWYYKGYILSKEEKYEEAISSYKEVLKIRDDSAFAYRGIGVAFYNLGNYEVAISNFLKSLEFYKSPSVYKDLGKTYSAYGQYENAFEVFHKALDLSPNYHSALAGIADTHLLIAEKQVNDLELKNTHYEEAFLAFQKIPDDLLNSFDYIKLLSYYSTEPYPKNSTIYFERFARVKPSFSRFMYSILGRIYYDLGNFLESISSYTKAKDRSNNSDNIFLSEIYFGIGRGYRSLKDYKNAIINFKKALKLDSKNARRRYALADTYLDNNQLGIAEKLFNELLLDNPSYYRACYSLGNLYFNKENLKKSKENYERYLEFANDDLEMYVQVAKSRLENIERRSNKIFSKVSKIINDLKHNLIFDGDEIIHYTSVEATEALLLNKGKFRISEGTYFNDSSEGKVLKSFLQSDIFDFDDEMYIEFRTSKFMHKPFIGSFVPNPLDNKLTLWRMYGKSCDNDANGCSFTIRRDDLLLKIKDELYKNKLIEGFEDQINSFKFYRVVYYDSYSTENSFHVPDVNLDINKNINELLTSLNLCLLKNSKAISLNDKLTEDIQLLLDSIQYLFKTCEYRDEAEIRLIVKNPVFKKHTIEGSTPKRIAINLCEIDSIVKKLTFGPKIHKVEEWAAYFYHELDNKNLNPQIYISKIPYK